MLNYINLYSFFYPEIIKKPLCRIVGYGQIGSALNSIYKKYNYENCN
jgi:lactate dehydrogenase-like 2-hydroxyacid dehydrogenase